MKGQFFKLAWRNIWRNKRRSVITLTLVSFFLMFVIFLLQMQKWQWMNQLDTTLSSSGYIQITDTAFVEEKSMDNMMPLDKVDLEGLKALPEVRGVFPRIQSGVLASIGIRSKMSGLMGIIPSADNEEMKMGNRLIEGELLEDDDNQILITEQMSKFYQVKTGDSLILFGSGFQGYTAAGHYRIKGVIRFPAGDLANMVFMPLKECQLMMAAEGMVTTVMVNLNEDQDLHKAHRKVNEVISDPSLIARNWEEIMPELKGGMELDMASNHMIAGILLLIVSFGIFGTIVMMYSERLFEFGILLSIGMKKRLILLTTLAEIYLLMFLGVLLGCAIVTPILLYFNFNPIKITGSAADTMVEYGIEPVLSVGLYPSEYLSSSFIIMLLTVIMSIYVVVKILKLKPLDAMKKN